MSLRYIGSPPVFYPFNCKPTRISRLHYLSRQVCWLPSHTTTQNTSTTPRRNFLTQEEAKIAHEKHFRQLCELEAALIPFEHRRDAAKVRLAQTATMDTYTFPDYRLKKTMDDPSKTPLLLVACGSFSPITFLHLRMFIMAGDYIKFSTDFEIVGGYLSPVSDAYKKAGLASAEHRCVASRFELLILKVMLTSLQGCNVPTCNRPRLQLAYGRHLGG
jgi:Cytidylyltransferase-like